MTEQEQKAFEQIREALEGLLEIEDARIATGAFKPNSEGQNRITNAREALTAANAVQPQFMGFDVVVDPTMKPNEMKLAQPQAQVEAVNPHNVERPNEQANYGHDNSVSPDYQTPYYCAKCDEHMGDVGLPKDVPLRKYAVCYRCEEKESHPQATEPAGWKLVPVEPTPEMIAAIWAHKSDSLQDCYRALLAAAPEAHHGK